MPPRLLLSILLAALLVSAPGAMDSSVGGTPFSILGYVALSIVFCAGTALVFFPVRRSPGWWLPAALLVLLAVKVAAGLGDVPSGWQAAYRYGDTKGHLQDARFYWRFASQSYRVEPVIGLSDVRSDLHFFNDVNLYGYPPYDFTPREIKYPLEVTWKGFVETRGERLVWLVSADGRVTVTTPDGVHVLENPSSSRITFASRPGPQHLSVTYVKPAGQAPFIKALLADDATGRPVPTTVTEPRARGWATGSLTSALVWLGVALLVTSLVAVYARLGTKARAEGLLTRAAGLAVTIALVGWAIVLAIGADGSTAFLAPGGDPLYYGSSARDILHNGPLMLHGAPLGQASPFYFYPMYPYMLALGHAFLGESVSAIYFVNGLLVALLPALFLALGWSRLPAAAGVVAFAALAAFLWFYGGLVITFAQPSFTDLAYMTLVFMALVALSRAFASPTPARLVVAGVFMAFGAATRPSLMTLVYLSPFGLAFAMDRRLSKRWVIAAAWLGAGVALGLMPFTLRNGIAAGRFVVLVNSWIQIPYFLIPPEIAEKPGGMPGLVDAIVMAWGIFLEYPMRTLLVEVRKVLYTLGITAVGPPEMFPAHGLVVLPVLFGWAVVARCLYGPTAVVVMTFAVSHLLAMVVAAPWTFHYKSILPLHAAFLFGAAFLLHRPLATASAASDRPR